MKSVRITNILIGWIVTVTLIIVLCATWLGSNESEKHIADDQVKRSSNKELKPASTPNPTFRIQSRERRAPLEPFHGDSDDHGLSDLLAAGELHAIHHELQGLAEAKQLATIAGLLKSWCREGRVELVQWSLALSGESDPRLNLMLCAEALSNPSETIREIAAVRLENESGTHFTSSHQARSWLASRPGR